MFARTAGRSMSGSQTRTSKSWTRHSLRRPAKYLCRCSEIGGRIALAPAPVPEDCLGRVMPRRAHHAAPRMRSGPAQIQPPDWRAILRPSRHRAHAEEAIRGHFSVEDVPTGERKLTLEIERTEYLPVN